MTPREQGSIKFVKFSQSCPVLTISVVAGPSRLDACLVAFHITIRVRALGLELTVRVGA